MEGKEYNNKLTVFRRLFNAYYAKLHRYAFTIVKNNDVADDITQTVFLKLWEKRDKVLMDNKIGSYLYKTAYHLSLNSIRNNKVKERYIKDISENRHSSANNIDDEASASDLSKLIREVTERLPARCQLVFLKSRVEGKKYTEIATEMNISVKTVEAQISKALKIFREELKDYL